MALIGKIAIAMAVDTKKFGAGLKTAQGMMGGFQAKIEQSGSALKALLAGAAAYKAAGFIGGLVTKASDLSEATGYLEDVYGDAAKTIIADSERMAVAFGASKAEFLQSAASLGETFKNLGYASKDAATLSTSVIKLAGDLQRAKNISSFADALRLTEAMLKGDSEAAKRLGVSMSETTVKLTAAKMGITKVNGSFTDAQKTQIALKIAFDQTASAQGNLAKTADEVAGAMSAVSGRVENLSAEIGQSLEPIAKAALGEMNTALAAMSLAWEENKSSAIAWATQTIGGVGETAKSMGVLQRAVGFVSDAWDVLRLGFSAVQSYITGGLAYIVDGLAGLGHAIDYAVEKLSGFKSGIGDYLETFGQDLHRLSDQQWEGFQKKLAQPWPSESIDDYFRRAEQKTKALRQDMAAAPKVDVSKIKPVKAPGIVQLKYASQATANSQEAANTVLRSRYGAGLASSKAADQTARNTAKSAEMLTRIAAAVGGGSGVQARPVFGNF